MSKQTPTRAPSSPPQQAPPSWLRTRWYRALYLAHLAHNFLRRPTSYGAYVAVWHHHKILIIKNSYKRVYTLPCGGIDAGETSLQAARRELGEETSLWLPECSFQLHSSVLSLCEYKRDHIDLYEVKANSRGKVTVDNREVIWADFLTIEEALRQPLFPAVRDYLRQVAHTGRD